jgi:hypothetical protein
MWLDFARCSSVSDLKGKLNSLRNELNDERLFKDFYMFVFEYAKGPEKKVLGSYQ